MRADRLVAALLVLQGRGRVTAAQLADELEVSVKTARRDLEALSAAGIPVYPQAGRGGGWQLLGGARTDLTGLTSDEARTLFLVAGPASTATPAAKAALRKLVQALPATMRADAEAAARSTVLDAASWGTVAAAPPRHLAQLRHAVVAGVQIRLAYSDRTGAATERLVHPLGVVEKGSTWYLVGDTANGLRTFRLTRIRDVVVLAEPVVRPAGFDLEAAWRDIVVEVEHRRAQTRAVIVVPRAAVPGLRRQFGPLTRVLPPDADAAAPADEPARQAWWAQRVGVELFGGSVWSLAHDLAGWAAWTNAGEPAEVLEPPAVRAALGEIGRRLYERYWPVAGPVDGPVTGDGRGG